MKKLLFSLSYILFTFLFASLASAQEMTDSLYIAGEQLAYKKYSESYWERKAQEFEGCET